MPHVEVYWCMELYNNLKSAIFNRAHTRTAFIRLDTERCNACWECIEHCSNRVIGKVDMPWHKHTLLIAPDNCTGCLTCIDVCRHGAYTVVNSGTLNQ